MELNPVLSDRYDRALTYARSLHQTQIRKGSRNLDRGYYGVPYISHLLAVSSLVLEHQGTETEAIAALLHDALEDGPGCSDRSLEQIRQDLDHGFGPEVLAIVTACSQSTAGPGDWYQRKQDYIDSLGHKSFSALLVTSADKLHNARCISRDYASLGEDLWSRFRQGKAGTLWYYRAMVTGLQAAVERVTAPGQAVAPDRAAALQALVQLLSQTVEPWPSEIPNPVPHDRP